MSSYIVEQAFLPNEYLTQHQDTLNSGQYGACCNFIGTMRDFNEGDDVCAMHLEHYPGMTEKFLQRIIDEAKQKFDIESCLIVHRVGDIAPNDTIVLTAAWSAHRGASFDACRYLIEELKHRAPFWKKEQLSDENTARWVDSNTKG